MINKANYKVIKMKDHIAFITNTINMAINKSTEATISNATLYMLSHNRNILKQMEDFFAENMDLMERLKNYFDVKPIVRSAIKEKIISRATTQILDTMETG